MSALTKLLAVHWWDEGNMGVCECGEGFAHWDEWAVHINALIAAEFLVVPRDIVGTEYGVRWDELDRSGVIETGALSAVQAKADWLRAQADRSNVEVLSHPVLRWTPISDNGELR